MRAHISAIFLSYPWAYRDFVCFIHMIQQCCRAIAVPQRKSNVKKGQIKVKVVFIFGITWLLNTITFALPVITGPFDSEDSSASGGSSCTVWPSPLPVTTLLCKTNDFGHRLHFSHSFTSSRDTKASRQQIDLFSKRTWMSSNDKNSETSASWLFLTQ